MKLSRTSSSRYLTAGLALAGLFGLGCTDSIDPHQDTSVGGSGVGVGGSSSTGGATTSTSSTTRTSGGSSGNAGGTTATTGTSPTGGSSGSNAGGTAASAGGSTNIVTGGAAGAVAGGSAGAAGGSGKGCYSPIQNTAHAYERDAVGCACDRETDADVCVQGVALICISGSWEAVYDGPCMPLPRTKYSPTSCTQAGGTPVASPGTPITAEKDCASGEALGIIDSASSGWDEGGLCCAPVKACGARAGDTCSPSQYCAYQAGAYCGAADAEATCKTRPTHCIELNDPVCGCNGKTYGNACLAAAAGTGVYTNGKCTN